MKFKFNNKEKEDSFLKTRTEFLFLPDPLKNRLIKKGIRTVRGLVYKTSKELKETTGSVENVTILTDVLDKLAIEIQLTEKIQTLVVGKGDEEFMQSELLDVPDFIFDTDEDIIGTFAEYFRVDRKDLVGAGRRHDLVHLRDLTVCVLREYADMSFSAIGRILDRDHTTIIHSYGKLRDKFKTDEKLRSGLDQLVGMAKAIKERKIQIENKVIPDLIASIRERQERYNIPFKPIEISERNRKVLELYREGLTLEQLGKTSGVTRERARQIVLQTIRQMAINDSIEKGIELDSDIIIQEEKRKRLVVKNKGKTPKVIVPREKTWSRYYLACKSCGTTTIPHRRRGLCQKCTRQFGKEMRDDIIARHAESCDQCKKSRSAAIREYGRDFYITKDERVFCRKCFLSKTGRTLSTTRWNKLDVL